MTKILAFAVLISSGMIWYKLSKFMTKMDKKNGMNEVIESGEGK